MKTRVLQFRWRRKGTGPFVDKQSNAVVTGLLVALFVLRDIKLPAIFKSPNVLLGFGVLAILAIYMIQVPLRNAGSPDEPAPPTAIM